MTAEVDAGFDIGVFVVMLNSLRPFEDGEVPVDSVIGLSPVLVLPVPRRAVRPSWTADACLGIGRCWLPSGRQHGTGTTAFEAFRSQTLRHMLPPQAGSTGITEIP